MRTAVALWICLITPLGWAADTTAPVSPSVAADGDNIRTLLVRLTDEDETVRVAAARELGERRDPSAIPALVNALQDRFAVVQDAATAALIAIGPPAAPALREQIGSTNIALRAGAASVLAGSADPANAEALCMAARDEVWAVREPAIEGLVSMGPRVLDRMLVLAAEQQGRGPESALRVISRWGPSAKTAEPVVLKQVGNAVDLRVRYVAAYALAQLGPDVDASLPRLRQLWPALHDDERMGLALSLARQGAPARGAVDLIEPELARAETEDGVVLAKGLALMGPAVCEGVIGRLLEAVQGGDKRRAFKAIAVLGWFGEHAKTALPVLLQEFKAGRDIWFATAAANSIGAMGPAAREAVPILAEFVSKGQAAPPENPTQRELLDSASAALQKIGRVEEDPVARPRRP